ncbi:hypothetical protein AMJ47_01805 [Parcubacteria bacterium DG_72]|nr:MAG: hypothetical protein AMJ47_01805 [Parcubacteria bacterium DG_72]
MKKVLISIAIVSILALPILVLAQSTTPFTAPNINIITALRRLIDWIFTIVLIVSVVFLIYAAFTFVTAAGDPEKIRKARQFVIYGLIGIAIAVGAVGLVALVQRILGTTPYIP